MAKSIYQKIWEKNKVVNLTENTRLLYVDLHLLHEVTSPQAFDGLRINNRKVRQPNKCFATLDHNVPTYNRHIEIRDKISKLQIDTMIKNCKLHNIKLLKLNDIEQGIVHIIGPELGLTQPGMVIVCGDSHTATHGALGALAFGIGTSEVEHVLSTQTLVQSSAKTMKVDFKGKLPTGSYSKDMILSLIKKIGTDGGNGYIIEYCGQSINDLSIEARMTICNMSIEAGSRAGLISPDDKTIEYLKGRRYAPGIRYIDQAIKNWKSLASDKDAKYDKTVEIDISNLKPQVTWGTTPSQVASINDRIPKINNFDTDSLQKSCKNALKYMGLSEGEKINEIKVDKVFIGSCTNARIEDLRIVADVIKGKKVNPEIDAVIVPGSGQIKQQAEKEGLSNIFIEAGFKWREAGCSMCLGMNEDILQPKQRCASTSNRNFEGRQGKGGRTHLVSPAVAAATAIVGKISNIDRI